MMDVIENMLLAEAVVPGTLGAVAELQIREIRVRAAADGTFVVVALLPLLLLHRPAELHRLGPPAGPDPVRPLIEIRGEEHKQVQQRHHRHQGHTPHPRRGVLDDLHPVEDRLQPGQPPHLDGEDEHDLYDGLRIGQGVGHKEGRVDVDCAKDGNRYAVNEVGQQGGQGGEQDAADVVDGKFGAAPHPLQGLPQPVVEEEGDNQPEAVGGWHENVGHHPPQLPPEHRGGVHAQEIEQHAGAVKEAEEVDDGVGADNVAHQPGNGQPRMQGTEAVNGLVQFSQRASLPYFGLIRVLYSIDRKKSSKKFEHLTDAKKYI